MALLVVLGAVCAVSPLFRGYYDLSVWGWIALACLGALIAVVLAGPARPTPAALLAVAGLVALWLWSYLSQTWGESAGGALTEANRWMLYAAMFAAAVTLLPTRRHVAVLLGVIAFGVAAIGGYVAVRLAAGDGASLFVNGRLNGPLGYVNGQAAFFALGLWPLVALAERRHLVWSPVAVALATMLCGLMVLSQARGVAVGVGVSAAVVLALIPGRRQRLWVLVAVLAGLLAALGPLLDVYRDLGHASFGSSVRRAGDWILIAAALTGVGWGLANWAVTGIQRRGAGGRHAVQTVSRTLGVVLVAGALVAAAIAAPGIARTARTQVDNFVHLKGNGGRARFLTGAGNRYDYWRIAWSSFTRHPFDGLGAGNYAPDYFLHRRTTEDIRQAHSVELQTLSELGIIGALALAIFIAGVAAGLVRRALAGRSDPSERMIAVAAGGTFAAWLAHTSVDWLHLLPGLTGIALASAAALCAPTSSGMADRRWSPRLAVPAVLATLALAIFAAVTVVKPVLAEHERSQAQSRAARAPAEALRSANRSLALDPTALPTYYAKSAAYARLGDYADARATLLAAARREPHAFVTWVLLGDLATRRGDLTAARRAYRRASRLNPRDRTVRQLATRPPTAKG